MPDGYKHGPIHLRFWSHIEKRDGGCWLWTGALAPHGYPVIGSGGDNGTIVRAHRLAWEMRHGPIPDGATVKPRCGDRACVRHLALANHKGSANANAKVTKRRAHAIRGRKAKGETIAGIARHFGLSKPTVRAVLRGLHFTEEARS